MIILESRESHSSWVRPEQGRLLSGLSIYMSDKNKVVIKQCFVEFEINRPGGNTVCVGDNCIIYGIGALRALEMVKPL